MDYGALLQKRVGPQPELPGAKLAALLRKRMTYEEQLAELVDYLVDGLAKYDEDQERDEHGRWTAGGGGALASEDMGDKPASGTGSTHPGGVKGAVHDMLASGQPFTIKEIAEITGAKEDRVKFLISRLQNPKYAAAGKPALVIQKLPGGKFQVVGTKASEPKPPSVPKPPGEQKPPSAPKPPAEEDKAKIGAHSFTGDPYNHGEFCKNNIKVNALIYDQNKDPGSIKAGIAKDLHERLKDNPSWQRMVSAYVNSGYGTHGGSTANGEKVASTLIQRWASTSGDHDNMARALQLAAQEEFKLTDTTLGHMDIERDGTVKSSYGGNAGNVWDKQEYFGGMTRAEIQAGYRAFTRAQYENTQAWFAKNGIKEVSVFRGMKTGNAGEPKLTTLHGQPLSSFSTNRATATNFGKNVYMATVPVSWVVGSCQTGYGCHNEREIVVMGHPLAAVKVSRDRIPNFQAVEKMGAKAFNKGP